MSPTSPHVLITFPRYAEQGAPGAPGTPTLPENDSAVEGFGPAPRATCEAAAANLDHDKISFMVVSLQDLAVMTASDLSKELDRKSEERAQTVLDLGGPV